MRSNPHRGGATGVRPLLRTLGMGAILALAAILCARAIDLPHTPPPTSSPGSWQATVYTRLDDIRETKRRQLSVYLDRIRRQAFAAGNDRVLRECFDLLARFDRLGDTGQPPADARRAMNSLASNALSRAVAKYRGFHDILFVAADGDVFHAIFRHVHVGCNLLRGEHADSNLARRLTAAPVQPSVVFDDGHGADEPSAWFVEPVISRGELDGWIIMQLTTQRINDLFSRDGFLGRTGETFLVNRDCRMLTPSRFRRDRSILELHLSPDNIDAKFAEGQGHKLVVDYRGYRAMTSFEVCPMLGSEWLLVAKIDEAEVLTDHFRQNQHTLWPDLLTELSHPHPQSPTDVPSEHSDAVLVEMDEFRRAGPGQQLRTHGVNTCTAVVVALPGEFAYMTHASSYDALHGGEDLDLLSNMLARIRTYEIAPYRWRELRAVVIAPHTRSIGRAIDNLTANGLFLSQITFLHNPAADSAGVLHDVATNRTAATWHGSDGKRQKSLAGLAPAVGQLARDLWGR